MAYQLNVNGRAYEADVEADTPLLWVLRDSLGLVGTKFGCGIAQCGACTVHVDGTPIRSCVTPVEAVGGAQITTIEGAAGHDVGSRVQQAWRELDVAQCGYCQPGQIMAAVALVRKVQREGGTITEADLDGIRNICRCGTYTRIREAVRQGARRM